MKTFILIVLTVLMFSIVTPRAQALFGPVATEKDRREHAEQQLNQAQQRLGEQQQIAKDQQRLIDGQQQTVVEEQRRSNKWQTTAFMLGIIAVITLIVGTAIGSKGRPSPVTRRRLGTKTSRN